MMLQVGESLGAPQAKLMKSIQTKTYELRIKDRLGAHRIIYILSMVDQILIPHAFTKKTNKTPQKEIELSINRLKEMLNETK
jgi:phage-related protein